MDFMKAMKQAQQMQTKMQEMEKEMENAQFVGEAGGGLVKVTLTGKGALHEIVIKPEAVASDDDDEETAATLEDMITAAHNAAKQAVDARLAEGVAAATGGMKIPGIM